MYSLYTKSQITNASPLRKDWKWSFQPAQDYYPFGMLMPSRIFSSDKYRFGFNGKENDNEVKGTGDQQDYGMRIYDPRLGKFLSVVDKKFIFLKFNTAQLQKAVLSLFLGLKR